MDSVIHLNLNNWSLLVGRVVREGTISMQRWQVQKKNHLLLRQVNWLPRQVWLWYAQRCSSLLSPQSSLPSQRQCMEIQYPEAQRKLPGLQVLLQTASLSSHLLEQSKSPSHSHSEKIHLLLSPHFAFPGGHVTEGQSFSSEKSPQSLSPSHFHSMSIQWPLAQVNLCVAHVYDENEKLVNVCHALHFASYLPWKTITRAERRSSHL